MRIRITGKRVAKGITGIVYDVLYIVSRTKELGLPADLLSMPEEPSKRGEMVSRSSAEARDRTAMEARFTAKKREYESSIAREKWQVKYDVQKDSRMVVSGGSIKMIMRGDCLGPALQPARCTPAAGVGAPGSLQARAARSRR